MFSEEPKLSPVASNWNVLLPSPDAIVTFDFRFPVSLSAPETAVAIAKIRDSSFHSGL
jgi:hypothetical protein